MEYSMNRTKEFLIEIPWSDGTAKERKMYINSYNLINYFTMNKNADVHVNPKTLKSIVIFKVEKF